jgi:hypothetical protein
MKIRYIVDDSPAANGTFVVTRGADGRWGRPEQVFDHGGASLWSSDGRSLLKVAADRIVAAPLDGTASRELYRPRPGSTDPVPDFLFGRVPNRSRLVAFVSSADGTLWSVPERGGRPRLLARMSDLAGRGGSTGGSGLRGYQTDGERFYYTRDERQSDIFVAEVSGMR